MDSLTKSATIAAVFLSLCLSFILSASFLLVRFSFFLFLLVRSSFASSFPFSPPAPFAWNDRRRRRRRRTRRERHFRIRKFLHRCAKTFHTLAEPNNKKERKLVQVKPSKAWFAPEDPVQVG